MTKVHSAEWSVERRGSNFVGRIDIVYGSKYVQIRSIEFGTYDEAKDWSRLSVHLLKREPLQ